MNLARTAQLILSAAILAACEKNDPAFVQGYIEGEFVHVASPFGGRLENLPAVRGQTVEQGALLFALEETG